MSDVDLLSASPEPPNTLLEQAVYLQERLIRHATGTREDEGEYRQLRRALIQRRDLASLVPSFVQECRTLSGFWDWIKSQSGRYEPRRALIREAFADLLEHLERGDCDPADDEIAQALSQFDESGVRLAWSKASKRKRDDPEGAITAARTLLETICKKILDDADEKYDDKAELPKLYGMTAAVLALAPDTHTEEVFKSILGGCQNIVNSLGTLRNRLGDAHGRRRKQARPSARHAALAVNLAGSMALFLVETDAVRRAQRAELDEKLGNPKFIEQVLSRIKTSQVVSKHVVLKKAGREWRGLSPFIQEATPSFYVNDVKGFFHCFSTGKHGSALDFLTETQGISTTKAVELLSSLAGLSASDWIDEENAQ